MRIGVSEPDQPLIYGSGHRFTRSAGSAQKAELFPHGAIDARALMVAACRRIDRFKGKAFVGSGLRITWWSDETASELLSTSPWRLPRNISQNPMWPQGWYQGASGTTLAGVGTLTWRDDIRRDESDTARFEVEAEPSKLGAFLRTSLKLSEPPKPQLIRFNCLIWHYTDMDDYETSIHLPDMEGDRMWEVAGQLRDAILAELQAHPASPQSQQNRVARLAAIDAAAAAAAAERARVAEAARASEQLLAAETERRFAEAARKRALDKEARDRRYVAVIYDSSYLMAGKDFLHPYLQDDVGAVFNIVPLEVMAEIGAVIDRNDERKGDASRGRGRILDLKKAEDEWGSLARYKEADLAGTKPYPRSLPLDADSDNDRRLIARGLALATRSKTFRLVILASRDGGIGYTVDRIRREAGARLVRLYDARDRDEVALIREAIVGSDRLFPSEAKPAAAPEAG